jgi:TolB-like protein
MTSAARVSVRKRFFRFLFLLPCLAVGMLCPGPGGSAEGAGPLRIAVLYFDNYSVTDREALEPFRKGLADTLISSLARSKDLRVVERTRMDALLTELGLQQSGAVTPETVREAGKILGVEALLMGSYTAVGTMLRIDARLVDVETSKVLAAEEASGPSEDFFSMEEALVEKILAGLDRKGIGRSREQGGGKAFEALLLYSRGLDALDRKDEKTAERIAGELYRKYPSFPVADERLRTAGRKK